MLMNKMTWSLLGLIGFGLVAGDTHAQFGKKRGAGRAKAAVSLVSSVEAVIPGQPFEVGIRFKLSPGWHIYWQNSGDSGLPPVAEWKLPIGFSAGDLRFPVPARSVAAGDIVTNVLDGEPVLLVTITLVTFGFDRLRSCRRRYARSIRQEARGWACQGRRELGLLRGSGHSRATV